MKFTIYRNYNFGRLLLTEDIDIECEGEGTEEDPLIIIPSEKIPTNFFLKNSKIRVILKNFNTHNISLISCLNVTIEKCKLNKFFILESHDIEIKSTSCHYLKILKSSYINIENSFFERVKVKNSINKILLRDCTINRIKRNHFNNIQFDKCKILNPYSFKSINFLLKDNKRAILIVAVITIIIIVGVILALYNFVLLLIFIPVLIFIKWYFSFKEEREVRKRKKLE